MRNVIIGGGPAGYTAAKVLREAGEEVTVINKENYPFYSRVLITHYLGDIKPKENLFLEGEKCYEKMGIDARLGREVVKVEASSRTVELDNGEVLSYDNLLVSSGSKPLTPPIIGIDLPGVFSLYTLDDAEKLKEWVKPKSSIVVIGGGLVSLKGLEAFLEMDVKISLVEIMSCCLPQVLDLNSVTILQDALKEHGVDLYLNNSVRKIEGKDQVECVTLQNGEVLPCQTVVVGTGVRPALDFLKDSGVIINNGIVVNEHLKSNIPGIYAAGDVAEAYDVIYDEYRVNALWPVAVNQGRIAGLNMAGESAAYSGSSNFNTLELLGLRFASFGFINAPEGYEEVVVQSPTKNRYCKLVYKGKKIKGGVFVNDIEGAGILYWLARSGFAVEDIQELALHPQAKFQYARTLNDSLSFA